MIKIVAFAFGMLAGVFFSEGFRLLREEGFLLRKPKKGGT
jgi:hypothetical protein